MTETFDDRIENAESEDELMDVAEEIAIELAREHFDRCYDTRQCAMCADDTPLSGTTGAWLGMRSQFEDFTDAVERRMLELGADTTEYVPEIDEHLEWVHGDFAGVYLEAFTEAAADPEDCRVCLCEIVTEDDPCGHEINGEECPVR